MSEDLACAHCGSPDGQYRKRRKLVLCYDCFHEEPKIQDACIGCDEAIQSYPEDQPCCWCIRNKDIVQKDAYRNRDQTAVIV